MVAATTVCVALTSGCDIGIDRNEAVFTIENSTQRPLVAEVLGADEETVELPRRRSVASFFVTATEACLGTDAVVRDPETDEVLARYGEPGCGGDTWEVKPSDLDG